MGSGASVEDASTVFSYKDFPKQLYVEGAGSPIANGKFVLRTDKDELPSKKKNLLRIKSNQNVSFIQQGGRLVL